MELSLAARNAFVTGANGGLGSHFAKVLAEAGATVAIAARKLESLEPLQHALQASGRRICAVALDVTKPASVAGAIDEAAAALGPLTVVVNNAGVAITKPLLDHTEEDWQQVIEVNLNGAWRVAQAAARHMVKHGQGGSIVNIASILGLRVSAQVPSYAASKAALIQLTKAMALELAPNGIRVVSIAPTFIETPMTKPMFAKPEFGQWVRDRIPAGRVGQPEDVAAAVVFAASPAASLVTGTSLVIDGGWTAQ